MAYVLNPLVSVIYFIEIVEGRITVLLDAHIARWVLPQKRANQSLITRFGSSDTNITSRILPKEYINCQCFRVK